jgi:hypothetical protein
VPAVAADSRAGAAGVPGDEGFRTIRTGERVRFHRPSADAWRAVFVIRLDQPDPEAFYE